MKKRIGVMPCPDCSAPVVVKQTEETGTIAYRCDALKCDSANVVKKTQAVWAKYMQRITLDPVDAPAAPKKTDPATPAPKKTDPATPAKEVYRMPGT